MSFCGELRLDGKPGSTELAATMLAASATPAGGPVHLQAAGVLAVAAAPGPGLGAAADLAHPPNGLLAVVDGWSTGGPGSGGVSGRVVESWGRYGLTCLDHLLGDWALAVFDPATSRLVLARSPHSMRRLVVHHTGERLLFGTEPAQLRAAGIPLRVDEAVLAETLTRDLTSLHETLLLGVERVPAGHVLEVAPGRAPSRRPFTSLLSVVPPLRAAPLPVAARELRTALEAAVHDATARAPVAIGLSGGLDSSTITGIASRLAARDGGPARVVPISMVFPGRSHDESRWVDAVEEHTGTAVLRVKPEPYNWDRWRQWTADTLDMPPRPNLALTEAVGTAARQEGLDVLVSGEGGDDWLTGWRSHWPDLWRAGRLGPLWRQTGAGISPRSVRTRLAVARRHALAPFPRGIAGERLTLPWIRPARLRGLDLDGRFAAADAADAALFRSYDQRERWRLAVVRASLPLLDTARTIYTGAGVDWRHPFHDRRVIEVALSTPGLTMYRPGETKPVLRAAAADVLPESVRTRRGKAHFDLELVDAVEEAGGMGLLAGGPLVADGWVDLGIAKAAWTTAVAAARDGRQPPDPQHGLVALWQLVGLDMWLARSGVRF
ncbi:asparagine synthase-related protein [Pseudofrankia inefficax]|uniref:asparagine synthase (glutamine-hydrolyzing) n=1 Tax=Pseudofrankia inefficax (strain DSM 45817 / CECT 9037 / DDB 130130 / EuI1c) TaxID=298654 RepID=E3IWV2_PSEI1|nr:asparagine synthase-related protein [Pseudofrankia inefficax]ADP82576.1 asparagine synthase [Pseudofrankia inefficax]